MSQKLADVREKLNEVLLQLSDTPAGAQSREVVAAFRKSHAHLIARASKELEDGTLVQMVSSLKKRRPPRSLVAAQDLFSALDQVVIVRISEDDGKLVKKNKTPRKLTLPEAENYLADARRDRERDDGKIQKLEEMIDRARPYIREIGTLEEGLAAADAADRAREKGED